MDLLMSIRNCWIILLSILMRTALFGVRWHGCRILVCYGYDWTAGNHHLPLGFFLGIHEWNAPISPWLITPFHECDATLFYTLLLLARQVLPMRCKWLHLICSYPWRLMARGRVSLSMLVMIVLPCVHILVFPEVRSLQRVLFHWRHGPRCIVEN